MSTLKVKRVHPKSKLPVRGTPLSVGYDLFSCEDHTIEHGSTMKVDTGIQAHVVNQGLGKRYYLQIESRSSLASRGIFVLGGIIDPDYTGNIIIIIFNHSNEVYTIHEGDKIAQMIVHNASYPHIVETNDLSMDTYRGSKGFGSTGLCM